MIDLQIEKPLTLKKAAHLPQLQRNERPPHVCQLFRWASGGLKGIVLETVVVGGSKCTTSEAVDRWIAALSGQMPGESPAPRTTVRRKRDHDKATAELTAAGW